MSTENSLLPRVWELERSLGAAVRVNKELHQQIAGRNAEIAELVAALEYIAIDDCGCGVPCDCYSWYTLADKAKEALAKVRSTK